MVQKNPKLFERVITTGNTTFFKTVLFFPQILQYSCSLSKYILETNLQSIDHSINQMFFAWGLWGVRVELTEKKCQSGLASRVSQSSPCVGTEFSQRLLLQMKMLMAAQPWYEGMCILSNCFKKSCFCLSLNFFGLASMVPAASGGGCRFWRAAQAALLFARQTIWAAWHRAAFHASMPLGGLLTRFHCCAELIREHPADLEWWVLLSAKRFPDRFLKLPINRSTGEKCGCWRKRVGEKVIEVAASEKRLNKKPNQFKSRFRPTVGKNNQFQFPEGC